MAGKPKVLVHMNGGMVTNITSDIPVDWDVVNWDNVMDKVEIITPKFLDWMRGLLTEDQIRLINDNYFRPKLPK